MSLLPTDIALRKLDEAFAKADRRAVVRLLPSLASVDMPEIVEFDVERIAQVLFDGYCTDTYFSEQDTSAVSEALRLSVYSLLNLIEAESKKSESKLLFANKGQLPAPTWSLDSQCFDKVWQTLGNQWQGQYGLGRGLKFLYREIHYIQMWNFKLTVSTPDATNLIHTRLEQLYLEDSLPKVDARVRKRL